MKRQGLSFLVEFLALVASLLLLRCYWSGQWHSSLSFLVGR